MTAEPVLVWLSPKVDPETSIRCLGDARECWRREGGGGGRPGTGCSQGKVCFQGFQGSYCGRLELSLVRCCGSLRDSVLLTAPTLTLKVNIAGY